jgi:hypothetical protein
LHNRRFGLLYLQKFTVEKVEILARKVVLRFSQISSVPPDKHQKSTLKSWHKQFLPHSPQSIIHLHLNNWHYTAWLTNGTGVSIDETLAKSTCEKSPFSSTIWYAFQSNLYNYHKSLLKSLALYRKQATGLKNAFTYSPWAPHTYDFTVQTSSNPSKIILAANHPQVKQEKPKTYQQLYITPAAIIKVSYFVIMHRILISQSECNKLCSVSPISKRLGLGTMMQTTKRLKSTTLTFLPVPEILLLQGNLHLFPTGEVSCRHTVTQCGPANNEYKNGVFWDVTPRGSCKNRSFRVT